MTSSHSEILTLPVAPPEPAEPSGIACIAVLLQFFRMSSNVEQLQRELGGTQISANVLVLLLRRLGLKSRKVNVRLERLEQSGVVAQIDAA